MAVWAFLHWWYGVGWRDTAHRFRARLRQTYLDFSVPILLATLFQPWRRIITYPGSSLADRARAVLDNLVSRGVGFSVRCLALLAAGLLMVITSLSGLLLLILWPILPPASLLLFLGGLLW